MNKYSVLDKYSYCEYFIEMMCLKYGYNRKIWPCYE